MGREYFCAYHSYLKSIEPLNDAERGRLFTACLEYSKTGEAPELRGNERFIFPTIRSQIDRDAEKYRLNCKKQSENARMRWHAVACGGMPNDAKHANEKEKAKEKEKEKAKEKGINPRPRAFTPPTVEEVATYCKERGNSVDPNRFVDFYASKGWLVGKSKMKDWKAAVRNWEREERPAVGSNRPAAKPGPVTYHTESSIDMDKVREFELSDVPVYGEGPR